MAEKDPPRSNPILEAARASNRATDNPILKAARAAQDTASFPQAPTPMTTPLPGAAAGPSTSSATPAAPLPTSSQAAVMQFDAALQQPMPADFSQRGTDPLASHPSTPEIPEKLDPLNQKRAELFRGYTSIRNKERAAREEHSTMLANQRNYRDMGMAGGADELNKKLGFASDQASMYGDIKKQHTDYFNEQLDRSVGEEVDKDVNSLTMDRQGLLVADPAKVREKAERFAAKYGLAKDQEFVKDVQNRMDSRVQAGVLKPRVDKLFDEEKKKIISEEGDKVWRGFTTDSVEYAHATETISDLQKQASAGAKADADAIYARTSAAAEAITEQWKSQEAETLKAADAVKAQFDAGRLDASTANQLLDRVNQKYQSGYAQYSGAVKAEQDAYITDLNKVNSRYNERFAEQQKAILKDANARVQEAAAKYLKEYEGSPEAEATRQKLNAAYEKAWKTAAQERGKAEGVAANVRYNLASSALGPIAAMGGRFMESTVAGLGGAFKGMATTVGSDGGYVLGQEMERAFLLPEARSKEFADLIDPANISQLSGQLVGGMAPSIVAAAGVSAATGGSGAPIVAQLVASSLAAWGAETLDISGRMKDDVFRDTRDMDKANDAAWKSFRSQVQLLPTYAFEGLPFVKGFLKAVPTRALRAGTGAAIEYGTEVLQEVPQNIAEKNIRAGKDPWEGFTEELDRQSKSGELRSTLIGMAPITLLGGAGQITESSGKQDMLNAAKSYAAKAKIDQISASGGQQWMNGMVKARGEKFARAVISSMYTGGSIDEATAKKFIGFVDENRAINSEAKALNIPGVHHDAYVAFSADYADLSAKAEAETSPLAKAVLTQRANEAKKAATEIAAGNGEYVTVKYPDGTTTVLAPSQAAKLFADEEFLSTAAITSFGNNGLTFTANGKEAMTMLGDFQERSMERLEEIKQGKREFLADAKADREAKAPKAAPVTTAAPSLPASPSINITPPPTTTGGATAPTATASEPTAKKEQKPTASKALEAVGLTEIPEAAPTSVEEGGGAVTPEAVIEPTANEERTTPEAPSAAPAKNTGPAPGVPLEQRPTRVEPVLTQDVPDDRVSLAAAYEQARKEHHSDTNPDYVIDGILRGAVNEDSFYRYGDRNVKSGPIAKTYFAKKSSGRHMEKSGKTIDVLAQEATDATGREVTPNGIVQHMMQYKSGLPMRNERMAELDQRYGGLYGKKLNSLVAKSILAKHKGEIPKFTPQEQAIAEEAEAQGVDLTELDDQDSEDYDNMSEEEDDIMFGGGPSTTTKFDLNAKRGTEQTQPAGTPPAQGEVRSDEGAGKAQDEERAILEETLNGARKELEAYERYFKKQAESLFDKDAVESRKRGKVKRAEPSMFEAEGDTRANSAEDMEAGAKTLRDRVALAEKALADYDAQGGARAQAAAQQTSIPTGSAEAKARKAAAILERAKLKPDQLYALPLPPSVWNGAIRAMQEVIIAGGKAVDAIAAAIKHIQASDWWKNKATQNEKDEVMSHLQGRISDLETALAAEDVASLKENIQQAKATGAQNTRTKQQDARKEFVQTVKDALKPLHGRMTPSQVKFITAAAAKVNPTSPKSVSRFERVAAKAMAKANYADDLSKAKQAQKRAKKLAKQADVALNHREALKAIAKVDVGMLNDPAEFTGPVLDYLQQFGAIGKNYQPGSSEAIIDAMGKLQEQTMAEYRNMLLEEFGVEAGSVDPQQLYDALESDDFDAFAKNLEESKRKEVADAIRQVADYSKMGLESYENEDLSATEKKTLETLRGIDIDLLSTDQQKDYIKTADNITLNDAFYGAGRMEAVAKATQGLAAAEKAVKSTPLRKVWTTPLKEMYQQQFASVSGMFRFLFGQGEGMAKFHDAIGMTDLILGKKKVDDAVSNAGEKMADFYTGLRKKYKDADTDTMRAAEGIAAYVLQPIPNVGLEESFALRKQQVADSIAAKSERTKRQDEAEVEQRAFDLVLNEATTRDELIRAMKAKAPSAWASVEFLANEVLAPHAKEVLEHRENFWNEAVDVDNPMYLPISYRFLTSAQIAEDAPGQFGAAEKLRKPKESANLIKRESVKALPKDRVIDMNIRRNTLNALERNLYDTYTSPAWQRMREFFRLPAASKVVGGLDNSDFMQSRLNDLRSAQMREGPKADNLERAVSAITNTVRKAASQIALGGFTQAIKQPADQLTSAMVNVGPEWVGKSIMEVNKAEPLLQLTSIGDRGELIGGTNWDNTLEAETAAMARALKGNKMERFEAATESYRRFLMTALTKSDVLSARTAWLAYYQKYLADKGIEVSDWQQEADMVKEGDPVRRQALAFAEVNADITQGSSDPTKQAKLGQRSPQAWANLLKAAFNPFSSFTIGMRERIVNDASDLMFYGGKQMYDADGKRTKEGDRAATAGRSLAATLASNIMFTVAKVYIAKSLIALGAEGIRAAFAAAAGDDDDDKQKGMAMMSLMMNILYTMRLMDADVYRMFSTAYRDEKKESKMSESKKLDAEQEKALRNAKNAYTSIMQSMLVSGFSPFAENALVDGINWGSYMMQGSMGELPTTKSTGAPMKYDYWVKQPEYPPLYRYGQGYHESNYGVFSVILDRASELQEQAKDAAGFGKASGPSVESPDDAKKRIEAMAKAAAQ